MIRSVFTESEQMSKALSLTVYLQIDFEDFELNFLKKGYKSDLTNLGFSLRIGDFRCHFGIYFFLNCDKYAKLLY